jgi:hypothetical protein
LLFGPRAVAETVVVPTPWGEAMLHFDPSIVSEDHLGQLALGSPYVLGSPTSTPIKRIRVVSTFEFDLP